MGGSSSSGKGSTTSTSAPDPQAQQAYSSLMSRANKLSRTPYTPYTGELVAGLTPEQQIGFGQLESAFGSQKPYMDKAQQYADIGASPLEQSAIDRYLNPYQDEVVQATMRQMENMEQANNAASMGQGLGAGGLFNDRLGVQQGQLANQEALANAQALGQLNTQSWNQALAAAQADRAAAAQGAYTFGNLGMENMNAILQGAGATMAAGNQQQQQQQAYDTALYNQWNIGKAYPYQQVAWASGIDTGLGSNMGGTSTTTPPLANQYAPYVGAGLVGASMFAPSSKTAAEGGRIPAFADGGVPGMDDQSGGVSSTPYSGAHGYIPQANIVKGPGPPKPPSMPQGGSGSGKSDPFGLGGVGGASGLRSAFSGLGSLGSGAMSGFGAMMADALPFMALARGGAVQSFADGGVPDFDWGDTDTGAFDPRPNVGGADLRDFQPGRPSFDKPMSMSTFNEEHGDRSGDRPRDVTIGEGFPGSYEGPGAPLPRPAPGYRPAPTDDTEDPEEPSTGSVGSRFAGLGDRGPSTTGAGGSSAFGNALASAGFALMANRSPFLGQAIGEAGIAGMGAYQGTKRTEEGQRREETKEKLDRDKMEAMLKRLEMEEKRSDRIATETHRHNVESEARQRELLEHGRTPPGYRAGPNGTMEFIPGGPADPQTIARTVKAKVPEFSDEDKAMIKRTASLYNIMGPQALTNLGRGAQGGEMVKAIKAEAARQDEEQGITPEMRATKMAEYGGLKAGERTAAVAAATVSRAVFEARNMLPQAIEAAEKLPRTNWIPVNKMIQNWQSGVYSSNEQADFAAANFSLINTYVRAIAPTGVPPDSVRKHAYDMLSGAMSTSSYKTVLARMDKEMEAAERSPRQVVDMFRKLYGEEGGAGLSGNAAPGAATPAPTGGGSLRPPSAAEADEARAAIAAGKPRDAIIRRMQEHGIAATGI